MKLALLIAALCTASCTAINLAAVRPKPQLPRANKESNKVLALRGGGVVQGVQKICGNSKSPGFSVGLLKDCIQASDGLLGVFAWSTLYLFGALGWLNLLPGDFGAKLQNAFESIYRKQGELGYIRFEILFILSAVANTAVLIKFAGDSARLLHWSAVVWATTFTLVVLKFYTEEQMGWIDNNLKYDGIQIFHIVFAALLWNGVLRGSAA